MEEPFIEELRREYAPLDDVEGLRLGGQMFGGRYLEDGYAYRIK